MNPLNRRMFRQPGMSRQPAGILASSPQLANTVANRQPVRMANGGTNTYTAAVQRAVQAGDKRALQELAKPVNYGAAARTPDGQNALRLARQAIAQSTQISTDAAIDAPVSDAERMAASRANLGALRGRVSQDALTDQAMAQINAANRPSKPPVTFAERGIDGPPNMDAMGNVNTSNDDAMQAAMQANVDTSGPSLLDRGIAAAKGVGKDVASAFSGDYMRPLTDAIVKGVGSDANSIASILNTDTRMSPANVAARSRVPSMDDNPPDATGNVFREAQEARAKAVADANMGGTIPPFGDEFGNIAPDGTMPGETLAASTTTTTTTPTTGKPRKVGTVDPDAPPPKGGKSNNVSPAKQLQTIFSQNATQSDATTAFENDVEKFNNAYLTGITANREAVIDSEKRLTEALDVFDTALNKERAKGKEYSLEDVRDEALKISGIDKKDYDESRKDAFFMGLMRAGLAMAAGESDNALTNIAKGLGIGLEGYGKDISTLNEQEREDRKELRAISMDLIKTKESRSMALAAAENAFNYQKQTLAQAAVQGADRGLIAAQNREATHRLTGSQLQANLSFQLNQSKQADKKLAIDSAYKEWTAKIAMLPEEAKQTMVIDGFGGFNSETGNFELTPEGQTYYKNLVALGSKSSYKITDLDKEANALASGGNLFGVKLSDDAATAKNQSLRWMTNFKDRYDSVNSDLTDPLKKAEAEKQRTAILNEWRQSEGGGAATPDKPAALTGDAAQAHIDANAAAKAAGNNTYTIGNQTFGVK